MLSIDPFHPGKGVSAAAFFRIVGIGGRCAYWSCGISGFIFAGQFFFILVMMTTRENKSSFPILFFTGTFLLIACFVDFVRKWQCSDRDSDGAAYMKCYVENNLYGIDSFNTATLFSILLGSLAFVVFLFSATKGFGYWRTGAIALAAAAMALVCANVLGYM